MAQVSHSPPQTLTRDSSLCYSVELCSTRLIKCPGRWPSADLCAAGQVSGLCSGGIKANILPLRGVAWLECGEGNWWLAWVEPVGYSTVHGPDCCGDWTLWKSWMVFNKRGITCVSKDKMRPNALIKAFYKNPSLPNHNLYHSYASVKNSIVCSMTF